MGLNAVLNSEQIEAFPNNLREVAMGVVSTEKVLSYRASDLEATFDLDLE